MFLERRRGWHEEPTRVALNSRPQGGPIATGARRTARTDLAIVDALTHLGVATIHEAQGQTGLFAPRLRPIFQPVHVAGNALTCEMAPGDNWSIHVATEMVQQGDIWS